MNNMETITIGKYSWQKFVGDEGQDVYVAQFHDDCEHKLGKYMEESDFDILFQSDADFYAPPKQDIFGSSSGELTEDNIIFKFRKNKFTEQEQLGAYEGLVGAAQQSQNRGIAAGPKGAKQQNRDWVTDEQLEIMDTYMSGSTSLFGGDPIEEIKEKYKTKQESSTRGLVWLRNKIAEDFDTYDNFFDKLMNKWKNMPHGMRQAEVRIARKKYISDTTYANAVLSGIAGFFDRYPRIPYGRATAYTEKNYETYEKCYPFMRKLSSEFKRLLPYRFSVQEDAANKLDPRFRVAGTDTPFTTITVNKNFRTAAHRDAGDLNTGFSNLTVVAKDKQWKGGSLVLPEFRVAVDLRPGDLLLINNHAGIHGNTELLPPEGMTLEDMERISLVCYFREKMLELGSMEYEDTRYQFVTDRRNNKEHPEWRELWNGVSPGMWKSREWYDYLSANRGEKMLREYHPEGYVEEGSLEEFF